MVTPQMIAASEAFLDEGLATEELMALAEEAAEPGDAVGSVLNTPSKENPLPMVLAGVDSAGYRVVYHTETGEPSTINANMLGIQLTKRLPNGKRAFTTRSTGLPIPFRGKLLCPLHKDHPERAHHDELGLSVCEKANLKTRQDVRLHMQHRHSNEWAALVEEREEQERAEEREVRRLLIQRGAAPVQQAEAQPEAKPEGYTAPCPDCGESFTAKNRGGWNLKIKRHKVKAH